MNSDQLLDFINASPTPWHATEQLRRQLLNAGWNELEESATWPVLQPGEGYFCTREGGSLCTFRLPTEQPKRAAILATHTDSPALKLKPHAEFVREEMVLWGTEVYGEPLLSSWLNRELGLAGKVVFAGPQGLEQRLVCLTHAPVLIPQLALHLDREVNDKGLLLNRQEHLIALAALKTKDQQGSYLLSLLDNILQGRPLLSHDLFLFPLQPAQYFGPDKQLMAAYRIDNLQSVHAALYATLHAAATAESVQMALFWDHEEIGSRSTRGADSTFFQDVLARLTEQFHFSAEEAICFRTRSFCASVDLAHALHATHPQKHEPFHQPHLGKGVVLKMHAGKRYASDSTSAGHIAHLCTTHQIPFQYFVNRSDMPCGSTVGPIFAARTGISTADIGIPQLSMHSSREVIACSDHQAMCVLLQHILET